MAEPGVLQFLAAAEGYYAGPGINHESEDFTGEMVLKNLFGGVVLWFRAQGAAQTIFHEELVLISGEFPAGLAMSSLNTNVPALQEFTAAGKPGNSCRFIHGDFDNPQCFRESVTISLGDDGEISYRFAWGMPGQPVADRSAATMKRAAGFPAGCPLAPAPASRAA